MYAIRQTSNIWKALVALLLAVVMAFGTVTPSRADQAAVTRNIILGAAAVIGGLILYNNWYHKQLAHNTVVGYTANGGTVYADGRVVYPNGATYYLSNNGQAPCDYDNDGDGYQQCGPYATAYNWRPANYNPGYYNNGNHYAYGRYRDRDDRRYYDADDQRYSQPRTVYPRTVYPRTVEPRTVAPRTYGPDRDDRGSNYRPQRRPVANDRDDRGRHGHSDRDRDRR